MNATALLIDNWTLQNAGELLEEGLSDETANDLVFSDDGQSYRVIDHSADLMHVEALFQVLHNLVLSQATWVEARFAHTWQQFPAMDPLCDSGLVAAKQFQDVREDWLPLRNEAVDDLCFCPEIARIHQENVAAFRRDKSTVNPLISQMVWGGAGMLARAALAGVPYAPHPQRERLFSRARLLRGPTPASQNLFSTFVHTTRVKLLARTDESGFIARFNLPPVVVEVLMEARGLDELLPIALQVREKYRELREWLSDFQHVLNAEDMIGIQKHHELLKSVARQLETTSPSMDAAMAFGMATVEAGTSFRDGIASLTSAGIRQRLQVRAQISRLILTQPGRQAVTKLLKLLGEQNTARGLKLERELLATMGREASR